MPAPLDVDCPVADPCEGKGCGEACELCDPSLPGCDAQYLFLVCTTADGCGDVTDDDDDDLCYAPCAGKACGECCADDCDPYDPGCPPSVYKTCDASGSCVENATPCF
ncbi:MAG: hypothetical protein WKG00_18490 [Polyangiaceae bacterium]